MDAEEKVPPRAQQHVLIAGSRRLGHWRRQTAKSRRVCCTLHASVMLHAVCRCVRRLRQVQVHDAAAHVQTASREVCNVDAPQVAHVDHVHCADYVGSQRLCRGGRSSTGTGPAIRNKKSDLADWSRTSQRSACPSCRRRVSRIRVGLCLVTTRRHHFRRFQRRTNAGNHAPSSASTAERSSMRAVAAKTSFPCSCHTGCTHADHPEAPRMRVPARAACISGRASLVHRRRSDTPARAKLERARLFRSVPPRGPRHANVP